MTWTARHPVMPLTHRHGKSIRLQARATTSARELICSSAHRERVNWCIKLIESIPDQVSLTNLIGKDGGRRAPDRRPARPPHYKHHETELVTYRAARQLKLPQP